MHQLHQTNKKEKNASITPDPKMKRKKRHHLYQTNLEIKMHQLHQTAKK